MRTNQQKICRTKPKFQMSLNSSSCCVTPADVLFTLQQPVVGYQLIPSQHDYAWFHSLDMLDRMVVNIIIVEAQFLMLLLLVLIERDLNLYAISDLYELYTYSFLNNNVVLLAT
jgi:hypothetical protein